MLLAPRTVPPVILGETVLKLQINPPSLDGSWTWNGSRLESGRSWIEPLAHPALDCLTAADRSTGGHIHHRP